LNYGRGKEVRSLTADYPDFHRRHNGTQTCPCGGRICPAATGYLCRDFQFAISLGPNENVRPSGGRGRDFS